MGNDPGSLERVCRNWPRLTEFLGKYPPEMYRCAVCKRAVEPLDVGWRMGFNGWEHMCPDSHPQAGHCPSERVPVEATATG